MGLPSAFHHRTVSGHRDQRSGFPFLTAAHRGELVADREVDTLKVCVQYTGIYRYRRLLSALAVGSTAWHPERRWAQDDGEPTDIPGEGTTLSIYLDGVVDGSAPVSSPPGAGALGLRIGARGDDTGTRLHGAVDEVAVYPHALTPERIASHHTLGRATS